SESGNTFYVERFWITGETGTPDLLVEEIVRKELEKRKDKEAYLDKEKVPIEKIIFYVYTELSSVTGEEKVAPDDIPDYKYIWIRGGELHRVEDGEE
ncbi:MAG: hypothetical protein PHV06_10470, partial [bacterium]|nr:hypothetical protein [bacterium]